LTLWSYWYL